MIATLTALVLGLVPIAPIDDEARALLDRVAGAYRGLDRYADRGERTLSFVFDGVPVEQVEPFRLAFERPSRFAVLSPGARVVSDGDRLLTVVTPSGLFETVAAPGPASVDTMAVSAVGSTLLGDPVGPPVPLILGLLTGEEPDRSIPKGPEAVALEEDREWRGKPVRVLRVPMIGRADWRLFIDPESLLIVGGEAVVPEEAMAEIAPPGVALERVEVTWSAGEIRTGPPAEEESDLFSTEPPAGMAEVGPLLDPEARARKEAETLAADPRVGRPAPQFTVPLLGDDGLGEEIRAVDLEGKVVLVNFWATWCGPCLKELPEVAGLIDSFAGAEAADDLRILCVSIDEAADEPEELAQELLVFLGRNELALRRPPMAEVALDASGAMARAFGVTGIPTSVLIGRDGTIRAVLTGFDPAYRRKIGGQIETLLAAPDAGGDPD
ncbi:TlpA family protein disulfide reductase [Tautonia sociabilis]|uniref:TlpA family protein disulfide reductase n=1 Tax=Tautonia sociabilis TaxID=2080755 RepID=A0A432MFJ9_9BACT|nr:TlpA disulfide reductase family protein [Tautonia sociabilis]RUL85002.1 TlpA family protein disulfide reductase [Tautonia sociabilis]